MPDQPGQAFLIVQVGEKCDRYAEGRGQFADFLEWGLCFFGVRIQDEDGRILVQRTLDISTCLGVQYMNLNSGVTKQGINMLGGFG